MYNGLSLSRRQAILGVSRPMITAHITLLEGKDYINKVPSFFLRQIEERITMQNKIVRPIHWLSCAFLLTSLLKKPIRGEIVVGILSEEEKIVYLS